MDARLQRRGQRYGWDLASADCDAAFVGGPVALAWSRFDEGTRLRVRERYVESIAGWRSGDGYRLPAEFVVVAVARPL